MDREGKNKSSYQVCVMETQPMKVPDVVLPLAHEGARGLAGDGVGLAEHDLAQLHQSNDSQENHNCLSLRSLK
jgi:hypothetical protein